jgi:antitoxin (DNA-binding transcriptional repressor) of toxin-antitoxin stability system
MKTVSFTEFRKRASTLFSDVEKGEVIMVLRHGKAVAEISPVGATEPGKPAWKKPGLRLSVRGCSLAKAILDERETS